MDELKAVNMMLESIGEAPISTLVTTGLSDGAIAKRVLESTNTEVQAKKWYFNTEYNYPLTPTLDNEVTIPLNTLFIDADIGDYTKRGTRLYDKSTHSYTITEALTATITLELPFDELPITCQVYVVTKASRIFQERVLGSPHLSQQLRADEEEARIALIMFDSDMSDDNMLTDTTFISEILER